MPVAQADWTAFIENSRLKRVPPSRLSKLARILSQKTSPSGLELAETLLKPWSGFTLNIDPLIPGYVEQLVFIQVIKASQVISKLLEKSRIHDLANNVLQEDTTSEAPQRNSLQQDYLVLQVLAPAITTGKCISSFDEAVACLTAVSAWVTAILNWNERVQNGQGMADADPKEQYEILLVVEAVGMVFAALTEASSVVRALSSSNREGKYESTSSVLD